ncbi:tetratricopeptide repeat protein [Bacillus carboniphilus]|uniref:Tetratricopeptide repeat protein n=1 Tax=Bacillus carboniphilus TaxID=86663 RepID=A0ABN0VTJ5_9BACI
MENRIRSYRIQKNITQEELANGIVSTSYLSKIENGSVEPSQEVLNLLYERLGVDLQEINPKNISIQIKKCYRNILLGNETLATDELSRLKQKGSLYEKKFEIKIQLLESRILINQQDLDGALRLLSKYDRNQESFSIAAKRFYHINKGLIDYYSGNFVDSNAHFLMAEKLIDELSDNLEIGEIYYFIALTYSQLQKASHSIESTKKALKVYQSTYLQKKCVYCHILLGINYRKIREWDQAEESYQWARTICENFNYHEILDSVEQNLGFLYEKKQDHMKALQCYMNSLRYKQKNQDHSGMILTYMSIVRLYYEKENSREAAYWMEKASSIFAEELNLSKDIFIQYKVYKSLLSSDSDDELEEYLSKEVIPYYTENKSYENIVTYSTILSKLYEKKSRYKPAGVYWKKAIEAYQKLVNV